MIKTNELLNFEQLQHYDEKIKEYIDNNSADFNVKKGGVDTAVDVAHSEEIGAISAYSVATGKNNLAGLKGWYYKAIKKTSGFTDRINVYLTNEQTIPIWYSYETPTSIDDPILNPLQTLGKDTIVSLVNDNKYDNLFKIVNGKNGMVQLQTIDGSDIPFDKIKRETNLSSEDYSIYCLSKPTEGPADIGHCAFVAGANNQAINADTVVFGTDNIAQGKLAVVGGKNNEGGYNTVTFGANNKNIAENAFVAGTNIDNTGNNSFITGNNQINRGKRAHIEGNSNQNLSSGMNNHLEGEGNKIVGTASNAHTEGESTVASGNAAHVEGGYTTAEGDYSHAGGKYTIASAEAQTAIGKYNAENANALFIVGDGTGTDASKRRNVFEVISTSSVRGIKVGDSAILNADDLSALIENINYIKRIAELEARIAVLESGGEPITFIINDYEYNDHTFIARAGMTWEEFVNSEYNENNAFELVDYGDDYQQINYIVKVTNSDYSNIRPQDLIVAGATYYAHE